MLAHFFRQDSLEVLECPDGQTCPGHQRQGQHRHCGGTVPEGGKDIACGKGRNPRCSGLSKSQGNQQGLAAPGPD